MVAKHKELTLNEFANAVEGLSPVEDIDVDQSWRVSTVDGHLCFNDIPMETTAIYQLGSSIGLLKQESSVHPGDLLGHSVDQHHVDYVNTAIVESPAVMMGKIARVSDGRIGGLVSRRYAPITHAHVMDLLQNDPQLGEMRVINSSLSTSKMEAFIIRPDTEWKVDGGISPGIKIHNGQFGDRSFGMMSMLFRLRCTNGMMDRMLVSETRSSHRGDPEKMIRGMTRTVIDRGVIMMENVDKAMSIEIDVAEMLAEMLRRGIITPGALKHALSAWGNLGGGGDDTKTLWALVQLIAAASRHYSIGTSVDLADKAGRLLADGTDWIMGTSPVPKFGTTAQVREKYLIPA